MSAYDELRSRLREAQTLVSVAELLGWDQETMMPPRAAGFRAEELALVSKLAHERHVHPRVGELVQACESDAALMADPVEAAKYQIVVMFMLTASTAIGCIMIALMIYRTLFNALHQLEITKILKQDG